MRFQPLGCIPGKAPPDASKPSVHKPGDRPATGNTGTASGVNETVTPAGTPVRETNKVKLRLFAAPCASAVLLASPLLCLADDDSGAIALDPVVVTAARMPARLSATLAPTIVIDRAQIEQAQAGDVAQLLAEVAGLDVARNGGPGAVTSVFTRGGESNHTLVLIDGVRVNPASAGGAALQNISPDMIERIEIVEGPRSSLYGSDAIAGVINIITKAPQQRQVQASLRGGSYGTVDGSAAYSDRVGRYGLSLETEQQRSDGFPSCAGADQDRGYRNGSFNLRGSADFGTTQLEARAWRTQGSAEYFDSCSPLYGLHPLSQNFLNEVLALSAATQPASAWRSSFTASRGEDRVRQDQSSDYVRTVRPGVDWDNTLALFAGNRLGFGAAYAQDRVDALSYGSTINADREHYRAYLSDRHDLQRHHLLVAVSYAHDTQFGAASTWNAEYGYDLFAATRLIASAGTGYRAPDADDLYGFGGNPDLRPERARNYELGLTQRIGLFQTLDLRAFRNSVSDLILVEFSPSNDPSVDFGYQAVNVDRARSEGLQARWRYERADWSARLSGILQNPKDLSDDTQLLRRARRSLSAGLTRRFGRWHADADVLATSRRPDIDAASGAPVTDGGYVLLNLGGGVEFARHWSLGLRVDNVLDRDYQTAAGYRQPGASVYASLRYRLR